MRAREGECAHVRGDAGRGREGVENEKSTRRDQGASVCDFGRRSLRIDKHVIDVPYTLLSHRGQSILRRRISRALSFVIVACPPACPLPVYSPLWLWVLPPIVPPPPTPTPTPPPTPTPTPVLVRRKSRFRRSHDASLSSHSAMVALSSVHSLGVPDAGAAPSGPPLASLWGRVSRTEASRRYRHGAAGR